MTGYKTKSMMCHPIKDSEGDVIGVAQVINKANEASFNANDETVFEKYLQFCGIGLRNAQLYERSQLEVKRNQVRIGKILTSFNKWVHIFLYFTCRSCWTWPESFSTSRARLTLWSFAF